MTSILADVINKWYFSWRHKQLINTLANVINNWQNTLADVISNWQTFELTLLATDKHFS